MNAIARGLWIVALAVSAAAPAQDYVPDWSFNAGQYYVDAFSGSATRYYRGERLAQLPGGDVVVAAVVPRRDGAAYALGLVRYDAGGVRRTWSNPGAYGAFANQYVVYDPPLDELRSVIAVKALKVWQDRLFVLIDVERPTEPPGEPSVFTVGHYVDILVFGTDGAFLGATQVMPDASPPAQYSAGGMELYVQNLAVSPPALQLVYAGTRFPNGPGFVRYAVGSGGALTNITGTVQPDPGGLCSASCEITGIALGGRGSLLQPPRIYLAGRYDGGTTPDFLVMQVNANGVPVGSFGSAGAVTIDFPLSSFNGDSGRAIAVTPVDGATGEDAIYVAGEIAGVCSYGAGLAKLRGDGSLDASFGVLGTGRTSWWPPDMDIPQPGCPGPNSLIRLRGGIAVADGKVVLAQRRERGPAVSGGEVSFDAQLTVVDAASGMVESNLLMPYQESGLRARHSGFADIVASGAGRFTATGQVRFFASGTPPQSGPMQVATLCLLADRLFADSVE